MGIFTSAAKETPSVGTPFNTASTPANPTTISQPQVMKSSIPAPEATTLKKEDKAMSSEQKTLELEKLLKEQQELQSKIEQLRANAREEAIKEIKAKIVALDLKPLDFFSKSELEGGGSSKPKKQFTSAKDLGLTIGKSYSFGGNTFTNSGKGRVPQWLVEAVKAGQVTA